MSNSMEPASFRDPSGFVFFRNGKVLRQVNISYRPHYDRLMESGLCKSLVDSCLLVQHQGSQELPLRPDASSLVLEPQQIPFISYPYEWCFEQLRQAALTTLAIQKRALSFGMTLKDASAYNIQFLGCNPIFIDTLSFEVYRDGEAWIAYRQFCQHFLAPLALMSLRDEQLGSLLRSYVDGVPLSLASRLLPRSSWLSMGLLVHIHLHALSQDHYSNPTLKSTQRSGALRQRALVAIAENLESTIRQLKGSNKKTEWDNYYQETNYDAAAMAHKESIAEGWLKDTKPSIVWDLGCNTGRFSEVAARNGAYVVAIDGDSRAVGRLFSANKDASSFGKSILPLQMDLANPSPAQGWDHDERKSLKQRGPADMVLALALLHHLAIGNNVPLDRCAKFFAGVCKNLIIEFVPKEDSQIQRMLLNRVDVFDQYALACFLHAFNKYFEIIKSTQVQDSTRTMYLMKTR